MRSSRRSGANGPTLNKATVFLLPKTRLVQELEKRGLDTSGIQTRLAERLFAYVTQENGSAPPTPEPTTAPVVPKKTPNAKKTPKSTPKAPPKRKSGKGVKEIKQEEPDEEEEEQQEEVEEEEKYEVPETSAPKSVKKTPEVINRRRSTRQEQPEEEEEMEQEVVEPTPPPAAGRRKSARKSVKPEPVEEPVEPEEAEEPMEEEVAAPVVQEEGRSTRGKKKAQPPVVNGQRSIKEEPPEEDEEPLGEPPVEPVEPKAEEVVEEPAEEEAPKRSARNKNKENTTPAAKKETKKSKTVVIKVEEPDDEPDQQEQQADVPSTSAPPVDLTSPRLNGAPPAAPDTPRSEEKRNRKKSARLLASEQMEQDEQDRRAERAAALEAAAVEPKKQKVTVKEEPMSEGEQEEAPPSQEPTPAPEPAPKKAKKVMIIKEEVDSEDEESTRAPYNDPDFQPPVEPQEAVRHSRRIKEHTEQSELETLKQLQQAKAEKARRQKERQQSYTPAPAPAPPAPKIPNWKAAWEAKMLEKKKADAAAAAAPKPAPVGSTEVKRTSDAPEAKKKKTTVTTSIDAIEALMSSTHKEKIEKKQSIDRPDRPERIAGGAESSAIYDQRFLNSPHMAPPNNYSPGVFFNQATMLPAKPIVLPPRAFPPVAPVVSPVVAPARKRQSRFDQPPPDHQHFYAAQQANAPPPTLTSISQISRRVVINAGIPPPPPGRKPSAEIPPPPPKPVVTATSDLQRRVQELFNVKTTEQVPAAPVVFSPVPRDSASFLLPPPPPPPPPPPMLGAAPQAFIKQEPQAEDDDDDDDFIIRDTLVEDEQQVPAQVAPAPHVPAQMVPFNNQVTIKQEVPDEDEAPRAINKVEEFRRRQELNADRMRRAKAMGGEGDDNEEYDPLENFIEIDESEPLSETVEYQPTTRVEDEEEEMEMNEGDDEDEEMMVDDEEEDDEEDEEEEEMEAEEEAKKAEGEENQDDQPINPMELLKRALPILKSSTVAEQPKNDYAQLEIQVSESLLTKQPDDKEEEVYYHGEPVPEVDENELYEIAAGIKPKKKDKKPLVQIPEEERVPADNDTIELDYYNADILVKSAEKNIWQIEPFCQDGLALMWGGIRSNFGIKLPFKQTDKDKSHRLAFQIQIDAYQSIQHLPTEFMNDGGDVRIGFSLASTPLVLGEHSGSWCITASGKKASNNHFYDFGKSFDIGDCVTCILDLVEGSISYQINGDDVGTPFEKIPLREGDVIYPTICVKNSNVNVNLGQELSDEKWKISEERDWMFITEMDRAHLKRSQTAPAAKKDCTVLMTVGLPAAGKTTWVRRYLAEHPHENWILISADRVMDAMKVNGVSRIRLPTLKRPDFLRGIIGKSMNRLVLLAPRRRKNYIIDMTNCLVDKRKKKLMGFEEFNRKCMIFIPDEDEHQRRLMKQEQAEGEKLDTDSLMQFKAGVSLPIVAEGEPVEEIIFIDPCVGYEHLAYDRVAKMNYDCRSWLQLPGRRGGRGGFHRDRNNYHHDYHQYNNNRPSTSGPPSGGGYGNNQYSPRNSSINITHTTFQPGQGREEPEVEILPPVKITIPVVSQNPPPSSTDSTPAAVVSSPAAARVPNQFSFPPPASPAIVAPNAPSTPSPAVVPQPLQALQAMQKQVQQKVQAQAGQTTQKKVEVTQPLSLNTSLPRNAPGPSSALSSAGRSSSFSQNSPRFPHQSSQETTPIPTLISSTPPPQQQQIVSAPMPVPPATVTALAPPPQMAMMHMVPPPMMMSMPPPTMVTMMQPPPQMFPIDVRVPPPNFSAPPPHLMPLTPTHPQQMMMYQQQQQYFQQQQLPPPTTQQYMYPPQYAPR